MLARRPKTKMRSDAPKCEWPKHRAFVKRHVCIVPNCIAGPIEAAHVRLGLPGATPSWARGGTSKKPHDGFVFPACHHHHAEQHNIGEATFARKYGVNMLKEALDLARHSPCPEVKAFVHEYKLSVPR